MKKSIARTILFTVLVFASIFSYIYINTTGTATGELRPWVEQENGTLEEIEEADPEVVLPDIHLLKKLVESGKRFLPAS